ncbi:MAG: Hsp70 family protein [Acidobacteriia bacterium]|nr:Hsp70 family protein [Terriglobia bacterium]
MKVGIDFGTTRVVAAAVDRGNYPLVNFETPDGHVRDWFPPLIAVHGETRMYGWDAWLVQGQPGWTIIRSLKRCLKDAGPDSRIEIGGQAFEVRQLLQEMMAALRVQLREHSSLPDDGNKPLEAMLGVPANANSNQRFLTTEAAREAGFEVLGLLNEPSAAAVEFAQRDLIVRKGGSAGRLLVYDLGGGTFDASLIELADGEHSIVASDGIPTLGGDDFDEILTDLALDAAGISPDERDSLSAAEWFVLLDECREKKEALSPNTRKITVDLERVRRNWREVSVSANEFYEQCRPLIESTRRVVDEMLAEHHERPIESLYVTGGGSELPPVARILRENYGRRVKRSAYMRSATAIGLAIRADTQSGCVLRDRFMRNFGLWREADEGHGIVFDLVFPRGTELPGPKQPPLRSVRSYQPAHNVGHFRYLECSRLAQDGRPVGEITDWDDIRFPFDPTLQEKTDLAAVSVLRTPTTSGFVVEETYTCDSSGNLAVAISNKSTGYGKKFRLGRWSEKQPKIVSRRSAKRSA